MTSQTTQIDLHQQLLAFGRAFERAYKRAGLSKRAVAAAVPLDRSAIGKIERGLRKPQFETVLRLARAAQTTPAALLGGPAPDGPADGKPDGERRTNGKTKRQARGEPERQTTVELAAKRFGENLKRVREAIEPALTQEELALSAKVDRSSVSGYETGRVAPRLETIFKLAETLGVGAGALLEGVGLAEEPARRGAAGRSPRAASKPTVKR